MAALIDMGGFENYIWTSYGLVAFCLCWLTYDSWRKAKLASEQLAKLQDKQTTNNT